MFNKKINLKVCMGLVICCALFAFVYVDASLFTDKLHSIGLDVQLFSNKQTISRYEMTRLLNAINCEDCIQAPEWMKKQYTSNFWEEFKNKDGNNFNDINFRGGVWQKHSYYYCVAYVGDNGLMSGYPSTSTKCWGNFCGQESITVSEFYQIILNIIQDKIKGNYQIDWTKVKSRMKGLKKNSTQMAVLNDTDIAAINNADVHNNYALTTDEFQAWMKYCMYNLHECNFQSFGVIGTGYWPVSELNILYKEGIITESDAESVSSFPNLKGSEALRIIESVHNDYTSCTFNVDYDCDGIVNGSDNCPYDFNPNQFDLDKDGIGNVCDDDIDGDGVKNPVGIVDDDNRIVISIRDLNGDQSPLGNNDTGYGFFINVSSINGNIPTDVIFKPLTDGKIDTIEWDFGDGYKYTSKGTEQVKHTYKKSGTFVVNAISNDSNGTQAFAMTKVFVALSQSERYGLNISPKFTYKNKSIVYSFKPVYSGNLDKIVWSFGGEDTSKKPSELFNITITSGGTYSVLAKGYFDNELKAVAALSFVQDGSPSFASMSVEAGNLWEKTNITTNLVGILKNDIDYVYVDWGDSSDNSTVLKHTYAYEEDGLKTIQQDVYLKNGQVFHAISTITVQNPLLLDSYVMNIGGKKLTYKQNESLNFKLNIFPKKASVLSLFTSYQAGAKDFFRGPDLGNIVLDYVYTTAGNKNVMNSVEVNRCVALTNQGVVYVQVEDVCENALKQGTLSNFKCDQDKDGIPDVCDDDIDGDGIKNLLGIITHENNDCSISADNIDVKILKKGLGVCSLDNCPFDTNDSQVDLNNNGIGDLCETRIQNLLNKQSEAESSYIINIDGDMDQDGVLDSEDVCVDTPGNSIDGCPTYYGQNCMVYSSCGNGVVDEGETCLTCPADAGSCCGNGVLDFRETCDSCPEDAGSCGKCGNGVVDEGENCNNCSKDVGECTAFCGNGKIEDGEVCNNCSKDVGECTAFCGNGKIEDGEDCNNCPEDVQLCKSSTCGNGVLDVEAGEECDSGKNNGKDGQCSILCTYIKPNNPKCGNGVVDKGEDCNNCPVDLGYRCVIDSTEECGNGKVEGSETCKTCSKDTKDCTAVCGNGKIEKGEDCNNCPEDVKQCRNKTCGNGVVDVEAGEECDYLNDNNCTKMCTKKNPNKPNCGNGVIDEGENCRTCPVDLGYRCVTKEEIKTCGNGVVDAGEDCSNCPEDVGECTAFCENGKIEAGEDCSNCSEDVKQCRNKTCGNGVLDVEAGEECDYLNDNNCTKMCTKKNPNKPNCGNGVIDEGEDCKTCPVDLGYRCITKDIEACGNGVIDGGETCLTCPEDVGECTAFCGNGIVEEAETCTTCSVDTKDCTAVCGNGKIDAGEDCINCPEDVKQCKNETCGNGVVDVEAGEECDYLNDNNCTKMCTKKNPNKPNCGNGVIDEGENCRTCPVDLGYRCVTYQEIETCGNGVIDEGETCLTCPKDVGECTAFCGNGIVEEAETCKICSVDTKDCTAICGNGKIDAGEDCINCPEDVKQCKNETCGNGVVDVEAGEECDYLNDNNCTKMCTKKDSNKPNCGNGVVDEGEDCDTCPVDLGHRCVTYQEIETCGNGVIDEGETCLTCPIDLGDGCPSGGIPPLCNSLYYNKRISSLSDGVNLCSRGKIVNFEYKEGRHKWIWKCVDGENESQCFARSPYCGDLIMDDEETCQTCSVDLKYRCEDKILDCGNGVLDEGEECDYNDVSQKNRGGGKPGCSSRCKVIGVLDPICNSDYDGKNVKDLSNTKDLCSKGTLKSDSLVFDELSHKWKRTCENIVKGVNCEAGVEYCGDLMMGDGEKCTTCPEDLNNICQMPAGKCGDGLLDSGEECDYNDENRTNWGNGGCSDSCKSILVVGVDCNDNYNKQRFTDLSESDALCKSGKLQNFVDNNEMHKWTWECNGGNDEIAYCYANEAYCGDGIRDEWEDCDNCPEDAQDICLGAGTQDQDLCGNGVVDEGEDCSSCPADVGSCTTCGNGEVDPGETSSNCPQDFGWTINNENCNACPCEYADLKSSLVKGDIVRAKLWDVRNSVFYRYSNVVSLDSYIDMK